LIGILGVTGCTISSSHSNSEASVSLKFTDYKEEMAKTISLKAVQENMIFEYSDFSLQEGEIVFQIISKDETVIFEEKLDQSDSEQGTISDKDLETGEEYSLKLFCEDAVEGSIDLEW
jgi:hypothetical protein